MQTEKLVFRTIAAVAFTLAVLLTTGCGDDNAKTPMSEASVDTMFVNGMIPHHQSAVEMAELAEANAEHAEIKQLAQNIIKSQTAEIATLKQLQEDLPTSDSSMMSADQMAAMHSDAEALIGAEDFDRVFIAAMIPHHESAVTMARRVQQSGSDPEVRALAAGIIKAQTAEIADMRAWSEKWYGVNVAGSRGEGHMRH